MYGFGIWGMVLFGGWYEDESDFDESEKVSDWDETGNITDIGESE